MKYAECEYVLVVICQVMSSKKKKNFCFMFKNHF